MFSLRIMKSVVHVCLFITGLTLPAVLQAAATIELNVESALARAPEANFQILLAREAVIATEERSNISKSTLFPQIYLNATQQRYMTPNVGSLTNSIPGIPERFFDNRFDAILQGRMALLDMKNIDSYNLSKLDLLATQQEVDNVIQRILSGILSAYFTHWRNERRLDLIDAILERDRLLLQIARDQQDAGVATNLDVTRAEVQLAGNELSRLQQETALMESGLELKRILNYPLDGIIVLKQEATMIEVQAPEFSSVAFNEILEQRADFQQLLTELERETLSVKASKRQRLPSLEVSGQWGYAATTPDEKLQEQWAIQLGLSMPLFEGFRINSEVRAASSVLRQKEMELEDLRQAIESEYRLALQNVQSSVQQVEVSKRTRDLSEREFELARIRFEEGVADNSDVVDAQASLADAEDTLVAAEYYYTLALVELARVEGDVRRIQL